MKLHPLPSNRDLTSLLDGFTSLVIVRNPFSRLVSTYLQKVIDLSQKEWKSITEFMKDNFRTVERKQKIKEMEANGITKFDYLGDDPQFVR